ncbi:uncharacterized protein [Drosophila virilis]|uniref:Uncharacterized protein n=1 Tax=Drosophila virilis TaxID=7244 RepID=B4LR94_DROVI|nr:uncharacterized protein LOC6627601 [Drosophila virilis]EDW63558.1 uncharacterized protein Dvir_GJ15517 [Drosophila virilis]
MASLESVLVAGLVHLFFRFALYITPQSTLLTPGPTLPTIIVGVAILDLIYDYRIVPLSMYKRARGIKYICECFVAILFLEVGMLIFWQTIEHLVYLIAKMLLLEMDIVSLDYYYRHETFIIGSFTLPISLGILVLVSRITNHFKMLSRRYMSPQTHVYLRLDNTVRFLRHTDRYKNIRFREAFEKYNSTGNDPKRRSVWVKYFQNYT